MPTIRTRLNTRGAIALQTVIIIAVLALGAAGGGIIIYNTVKDKTEDLATTDVAVEGFTAIKKDKIEDLLAQNNTPEETIDPEETVPIETGDEETEEEPPQIVETVATEFKQISALSNHNCAIKGTERRVWCWGNNSHGQLGIGEIRDNIATNFNSSIAVQATELEETNIRSVSAGHQFSCAVLMDKTIKCWGNNQHGRLGVGTAGGISITPVQVVGINNATSVIAGVLYACALLEDKTAKCWGNNNKGELGNRVIGGPDESFPTPVPVGGATPLGNIVSITIGSEHTCVLLTDKTAKCWGGGGNTNGQLGDGGVDTAPIPNPVTVLESPGTPLGNIISIVAGSLYTCALLENGTAKCWGLNRYGQLGIGVISLPSFSPLPVMDVETTAPLANIASISLGGDHTCVILEDETARCWGHQIYGAVGNGMQNNKSSEYPTPVLETPPETP